MDVAKQYNGYKGIKILFITSILVTGFLPILNIAISFFLRLFTNNPQQVNSITTLALILILFIMAISSYITALVVFLQPKLKDKVKLAPLLIVSSLGAIYWVMLFRLGLYYNPIGFVVTSLIVPLLSLYLIGAFNKLFAKKAVK